VTVTSNFDGTVYNTTANFGSGNATVSITLTTAATHNLTTTIEGVSGEVVVSNVIVVSEDLSDFALATPAPQQKDAEFLLSISNARDIAGILLSGSSNVTVNSNFNGDVVDNVPITFSSGNASVPVTLSAVETHTLTVSIAAVTPTREVNVTVYDLSVWTGSSGSDWDTPDNWDPPALPGTETFIRIPATTNSPQISSPVSIFTMDVEDGAHLSVQTGGSLTILQGGLLAVKPGGMLTAIGALVNNAGAERTDLIESDASGSGSVIHNSTGVLATVQRYIPGNQTFHLVSTPLTGQRLSDFLQEHHGIIDYNASQNRYAMRRYIAGSGWSAFFIPTQTGNLVPGTLYTVGLRNPGTLNFRGTLVSNDQPKSLTASGTRWTGVGNPFAAPLNARDGSGSFFDKYADELDSEFAGLYLWDPVNRRWVVINGVPLPNGDYLSLTQGFMLMAKSGGGEVSLETAMRAHEETPFLKAEASSDWSLLTLRVQNGSGGEALTCMGFQSQMSAGLDAGYDAGLYTDNANFNFFSRMPGEENSLNLTIQALPDDFETAQVIPLGVDLPAGGTVTLSMTGNTLPANVPIMLEDRELDKFTSLVYKTYTVTLPEGSSPTGRFFLHVGSEPTAVITPETTGPEISLFPNPSRGVFHAVFMLEEPAMLEFRLYDLTGRLIMAMPETRYNEGQQMVTINREGLLPGVYVLRINGRQTERNTLLFNVNRKIVISGR
jgi:hypothetical protein